MRPLQFRTCYDAIVIGDGIHQQVLTVDVFILGVVNNYAHSKYLRKFHPSIHTRLRSRLFDEGFARKS
jgi:hypothetical protein